MSEDHAPWQSPVHRDLAQELLRMSRRRSLVHPGVGLERSAFAILWVLSDGRPRTLRELTADLELEQSTVNRQVNAAIKHGYVERFEVEDSLSKMIRPTESGRAAFRRDGLLRAERLEQVFADLAPGSPQALLDELRAFNDAYERTQHRHGATDESDTGKKGSA
ncbi:MarR family winged helix-turn-helix transcriptional regulator [Gordonia terrae]|uniref:MarR family transcriptional regulator n=2 Tax=Gordonia terrae TaxID=2055 RepID=A0AAD0KDU1_9ACTN|nr:MarR family winged helix-turn-helix transcriptional regulator [Gordonia terrae]VTR07920.1 MarR family [Clostridioides difficile]ANY25072.1 MarR family transcriptional regulator [Gordonia terrae]AWO85819.1 MarR family transcriptional regulator [Gordonia terrae]VTS61561.1 MarR family [Gordonia terrae]GAB45391.1 putative MarR family transcriptional regulator [Gordonia terrae NBRC 100016]